jgi:peptidoglycan/LPS O-acetylase OafA/YrhL
MMFGALRLFLAFLVVFSHLVGSPYLQHFGYYALRGFYVLSGFLMTAGLNDFYAFDARRFWTNRLLRLLPLYYVVCALTLVAIACAPAAAAAYIGQWQPSLLWRDAMTDVFVLPLHHLEPHYRLVPTTWSLAVELEMYLVLFVFAARSKKAAMLALIYGLTYHAICAYNDLSFGYRYFGAPSAMLSFSLGALIYFYRREGQLLRIAPATAGAALCVWVLGAMASGADYIQSVGYYSETIVFAVVVAGFANINAAPLLRSLDKALGELAYPVFLVQWLTGFITVLVFMPGTLRGWPLALASIPVTLAVSIALAVLNGKFIEPLRLRVRGASADRPAGEAAAAADLQKPRVVTAQAA